MSDVDSIVGTLWGPGVSSHTRLEPLLRLTSGVSDETFWRVFHLVSNTCDATWPWRSILLAILRRRHASRPGTAFLAGEALAFFAGLPDLVEVYRGCSRPRIRGISWSTDRDVAARFAVGHRFIRVPDPVVARAMIPKRAIFAVVTDRNEREIILDPRRLRQLELRVL